MLARHPEVTDDNGREVAWELYEAFKRVLRPEAERPRYDAFMSYRRAGGGELAVALRAALQCRGLNVFVDVEGLSAGQFGPKLMQEIERAPNFLLLLTPGSLDRCRDPGDWLRQEVAHAIRTGRMVIPILAGGFQFPAAAELPPELHALSGYNAVTYLREFFDPVVDRLAKFMQEG